MLNTEWDGLLHCTDSPFIGHLDLPSSTGVCALQITSDKPTLERSRHQAVFTSWSSVESRCGAVV
jgi:hypothetical protein